MKSKIFTALLLLCCFMVCFAAIAGLAGKWSGTIIGPDGSEGTLVYVFKVDGDKLTGTAQQEGHGDIAQITDGKISGDDITFSVTNDEGVVIPHHGKCYADSISMNLEFNGAKFHTTLKRDNK
jgi:hypothetical protein